MPLFSRLRKLLLYPLSTLIPGLRYLPLARSAVTARDSLDI